MKLKLTIPLVILFFFIMAACDQLVDTLDNVDELTKEEADLHDQVFYHEALEHYDEQEMDESTTVQDLLDRALKAAPKRKTTDKFLQVIEHKTVPTTEGAFISLSEKEFDQAKKQAEKHLTGIQGEFREKNIESRTHVLYGSVVEGIISMAAQEGVDLIALASHGRGGLSRVFYGSVAAGLLHRVDRPLLIIRSRKSVYHDNYLS